MVFLSFAYFSGLKRRNNDALYVSFHFGVHFFLNFF